MCTSTDLTSSLAIVRQELDHLDESLREKRLLAANLGKALDVRRHNVDIVSATIQEGWGNISELEAHKIDLDQVLKCLKKEYEDAQATEQVIHDEVQELCERINKYVAKFGAECNAFGASISQNALDRKVNERKTKKTIIEREIANIRDSNKQYQEAVTSLETKVEEKRLKIKSLEQENTRLRTELVSAAHLRTHLSSQVTGLQCGKSTVTKVQSTALEMSIAKENLQNEISLQLREIYQLEQEQQQLKEEHEPQEAKLHMLELSVKALSGVPSSHSSHSTNAPPRLPEQLLDDCKKKEDYGQLKKSNAKSNQGQRCSNTLQEAYIVEEPNSCDEETDFQEPGVSMGYNTLDTNHRTPLVGFETLWAVQQTITTPVPDGSRMEENIMTVTRICSPYHDKGKTTSKHSRGSPQDRVTKREKPMHQTCGPQYPSRGKKQSKQGFHQNRSGQSKDVAVAEVDLFGGRRHTILH